MISIASLIFKSTAFADSTWESLMENTPHLHDGRARFFFVANDATPAVKEHLAKKGYPFVCQENKDRGEEELLKMGYSGPSYIHRVYRGWNRAIIESEEQAVLINSDMKFSPGWLEALEEHWDPNAILTSTLVERWQDKFGPKGAPGAVDYFLEADFGSHPKNFNNGAFLEFSKAAKKPGTIPGRHYACVMLSRSKAIEAGLYPEGNMWGPWGRYSGDQVFFGRLMANGALYRESTSSIVYHFNEGETEDKEVTNRGLSIIVPCDIDRLDQFKKTYRAYLDRGMPLGLDWEFILVTRTIDSVDLPGVRVVKYVHEGPYFNASKAFNIGVVEAKYSTVAVTSPEVVPVTDVINQWFSKPEGNYICTAFDQDEHGVLTELVKPGKMDHIPSMYFLGIFRKEDILKINGWDEDFMAGFSWEDVDFGERFHRANLQFQVAGDMQVLHQYHPRNYHNPGWEINAAVLKNNIKNYAIRCINGIIKE